MLERVLFSRTTRSVERRRPWERSGTRRPRREPSSAGSDTNRGTMTNASCSSRESSPYWPSTFCIAATHTSSDSYLYVAQHQYRIYSIRSPEQEKTCETVLSKNAQRTMCKNNVSALSRLHYELNTPKWAFLEIHENREYFPCQNFVHLLFKILS